MEKLVPKIKPQCVYNNWNDCIPNEGKWEYSNKTCFMDEGERDALLMCLLTNSGLERLVEMLPYESLNDLKILIDNKLNKVYCEKYDAYFDRRTKEWLEGKCDDPDCLYCPNRPDTACECCDENCTLADAYTAEELDEWADKILDKRNGN